MVETQWGLFSLSSPPPLPHCFSWPFWPTTTSSSLVFIRPLSLVGWLVLFAVAHTLAAGGTHIMKSLHQSILSGSVNRGRHTAHRARVSQFSRKKWNSPENSLLYTSAVFAVYSCHAWLRAPKPNVSTLSTPVIVKFTHGLVASKKYHMHMAVIQQSWA